MVSSPSSSRKPRKTRAARSPSPKLRPLASTAKRWIKAVKRCIGFVMMELMKPATYILDPHSAELRSPEKWKDGLGIQGFLSATQNQSLNQLRNHDFLPEEPGSKCFKAHVLCALITAGTYWDILSGLVNKLAKLEEKETKGSQNNEPDEKGFEHVELEEGEKMGKEKETKVLAGAEPLAEELVNEWCEKLSFDQQEKVIDSIEKARAKEAKKALA
ncbi:uncharacterized protein PAC_20022 [Phialocephala subalpina]|uniref:Uncharacterized protein n=1 Tax=Phialocephala subalpina TaxID=576137 RepID=A0A1L7XYH5_9HELO|nr:uncharacterized protein PAC_20022 [Phialocephala subalpina]